jgi:transcriptional regulator with XRE-family HTH domain
MKTWHEALKILLEEIDLSVVELAEITGSSPSNLSKFFGGKSNSSIGTLQKWLNACENHHDGAIKKFHLICLEESLDQEVPPLKLKAQKFTIQDHVNEMDCQQMSAYLAAMSVKMEKDRIEDLKRQHQSEQR